MEKHRRKKHNAHKRALVIVNEHRPYLARTPGGTITVETLDHAVADEAATVTDQESGRFELVAAVARVEKCRRWLQDSVKHFATVSTVVTPAGGPSTPFDGSRPPSDTQLIARVEAIHAAASADPDTFVKGGITPHGLDALAAELATFKTAKDTMTLAGKQHTEATERFARAAHQATAAILVLEGVLATEPDAPPGALAALRAAKRIGPRVEDDVKPATSTTPPATAPVPEKAA